MKTYQTDSSFFYVMHMLGNFPWTRLIAKWFETHKTSRYRLIDDEEYNVKLCHLSEVLDTYPGVKIVTVVMNPWLRAYLYFCIAKQIKEAGLDYYRHLVDRSDTSSFENFVKHLATNPEPTDSWYTFSTPQSDWIEWDDAPEDLAVFPIRLENLAEGFKRVEGYFMAGPLDLSYENFAKDAGVFSKFTDFIDNYQQFYTDETKEIIAQLWAKDIERWGYQF